MDKGEPPKVMWDTRRCLKMARYLQVQGLGKWGELVHHMNTKLDNETSKFLEPEYLDVTVEVCFFSILPISLIFLHFLHIERVFKLTVYL